MLCSTIHNNKRSKGNLQHLEGDLNHNAVMPEIGVRKNGPALANRPV